MQNLSDKLAKVRKDLKPISLKKDDEFGQFKGIDSEGNVYLIEWLPPLDPAKPIFRRKKTLLYTREQMLDELKYGDVYEPPKVKNRLIDDI